MNLIVTRLATSFFEQLRHLLLIEAVVCHRILCGVLRGDHIRAIVLGRIERPIDNDDPTTWFQHADQGAKHGKRIGNMVQRHGHDGQVKVSKVFIFDCRAIRLHQIVLDSPHSLGLEVELGRSFIVKLHHALRHINTPNLIHEGF